jgi:AcrR family transcriptional regulator
VTLFRRYGDKAALINAALKHALTRSPFARLTVTDDVAVDLAALVGAYADAVQEYGGAMLTLLTEVPRHEVLRDAVDALTPNMRNAARVIAAHQEQGHLAQGDPMKMLTILIAPLMAFGLWHRVGDVVVASDCDPDTVVRAFLDGHRIA